MHGTRIIDGFHSIRTNTYWFLIILVTPVFALKLQLVFSQAINWDEFLFLAKIYSYLRGDPSSAFQTGYIHAFTWLTYLPGNEIDQIIFARMVMYVLQAATSCFIFLIARRLCNSTFAAMISVYAYVGFTYTIEHGISFRADPLAAFLLILALWLLIHQRNNIWTTVAAGLVTALAGMVTIKSVFYVPTLALAATYLRGNTSSKHGLTDFFVFGASALASFVVIYALHRYAVSPPDSYSASNVIAKSSDKTLSVDQLFPGATYLLISLHRHPAIWLLIMLGLVSALLCPIRNHSYRVCLGLIGLALPITTLAFYRNAYQYYYVFALASPVLLASWAVSSLEKVLGNKQTVYLHGVIIITIFFSSMSIIDHYHTNTPEDHTLGQRDIIDVVHQMFPHPTPYIDRASAISSFPKLGFFMSTWGIENYRETNKPIVRQLLIEQSPVFLIVDERIDPAGDESAYSLLTPDITTLRENYIPHWGAIWIAGKNFNFDKIYSEHTFEILIAGTYTVESDAPVLIDDVAHPPHATVALYKGAHTIVPLHQNSNITLRWGNNIFRPAASDHSPKYLPFF